MVLTFAATEMALLGLLAVSLYQRSKPTWEQRQQRKSRGEGVRERTDNDFFGAPRFSHACSLQPNSQTFLLHEPVVEYIRLCFSQCELDF